MPDTKPPFRFWRFFFSPKGRVSRKAIWFFALPIRLTLLALGLIMQAIGFPVDSVSTLTSTPWFALNMTAGIIGLLTVWPMFVLLTKRFHDIGWTGLPALTVFVPLGWGIFTSLYMVTMEQVAPRGQLISLVLTGFGFAPLVIALILAVVPGQKNTNRFGPPVTCPADDEAKHF